VDTRSARENAISKGTWSAFRFHLIAKRSSCFPAQKELSPIFGDGWAGQAFDDGNRGSPVSTAFDALRAASVHDGVNGPSGENLPHLRKGSVAAMSEPQMKRRRAGAMIGSSDVSLAQQDGGPPTILATGSAPGESGVSIFNARFVDGAHFRATPRQHLVWFQLSPPPARMACRIAGRELSHQPAAGALAICPAGVDSAADAKGSVDTLVVAVDPGQLSLAAAEDSALEARLNARLSGHDQALLDLARRLTSESADAYPNGPLFWSEIAHGFIAHLVARYTSARQERARGMLGPAVLERLRDYITAHLDEPIDVEALADLAGRSPFHFSRVFTRSVGLTPHRYVVHLRLRRAIELVREGRSGLAEIAARTGFSDQAHLSRWVRRVHGVSLTQLA
jgi:AraC family transcriptional regulator